MRIDVRYQTCFSYPEPVRESHNVLRACPAADERQQLLAYRVSTLPAARVLSHVDYWGTRVDTFGVMTPHDRLEVLVEAAVETRPTGPMTACPRLSRLRDAAFVEEHLEYLERSPHTVWRDALRREAEIRAAATGDDVVGVVLALHRTVGTSFTYAPGATYIGMDVNEVFRQRKGVCQDFAHLLIAMCRSVGVPARYVSGYLPAAGRLADGNVESDQGRLKTHAWVEVAIPGAGWWGLDPTNQQEVGPLHVKIGHGRDYDDVLPLRGVYRGPAEHSLEVSLRVAQSSGRQQ